MKAKKQKPKKTEAAVTKDIKNFLDRLKRLGEPIFFVKLHGGPMQRAGLPDWLIIYHGRTYAIEVKRPGGKATRLQEHTLAGMRRAGAIAAETGRAAGRGRV